MFFLTVGILAFYTGNISSDNVVYMIIVAGSSVDVFAIAQIV